MQTALITGASGGIGYELAKVFARHGHHLVLVARNTEKLTQLANELTKTYGISARVLAKDLSLDSAPEEIMRELGEKKVSIDFLVNNAGVGEYGPFTTTDWKKEDQMIRLNMLTLTHLTKLFSQEMVKRGRGRILNVASTAAFQPGPLMAVYFATKAYVLSFSEAISNELQGTGVTVTVLCPGPTASGFAAAAAMEDSRLFSGGLVATSAQVAEYGYQAMIRGQRVAIHGLLNRILATSIRFTPRRLAAAISRKIIGRKNG